MDAHEGYPRCALPILHNGDEGRYCVELQGRLSTLQEDWSNEEQRVLALCRKCLENFKFNFKVASYNELEELEELMYTELDEMTLVGLTGIRDPPRADAPGASRKSSTFKRGL